MSISVSSSTALPDATDRARVTHIAFRHQRILGLEASLVLLIREIPSLVAQYTEQLGPQFNQEKSVKRKERFDWLPEAESIVLHFIISSDGKHY